jgi:hypothetical protein
LDFPVIVNRDAWGELRVLPLQFIIFKPEITTGRRLMSQRTPNDTVNSPTTTKSTQKFMESDLLCFYLGSAIEICLSTSIEMDVKCNVFHNNR